MSDKDTNKKDRERDPKDRRPPEERSGNVSPADPHLTKWLEKLWTRGNPPDRLRVWWMLGVNKDIRRDLVFYENFKQDDKLDIEQCARLCGEILSAAQDWADGKRRPCSFEIAITDFHQETAPLCRTIGPLHPQKEYAGVAPDGEPQPYDDEEEDGTIGIKPITHKYLSKMVRSVARSLEQVHIVMGDFMQIQQGALQSRDAANERLHVIISDLHEKKQTAEDRAAERAIWVRKEEAKVKVIEGSIKAGTAMAFRWLGMQAEEPGEQERLSAGDSETPTERLHPVSREHEHVDTLIREAAEERLSVQLFGDWEDRESLTVQDVLAGFGLITPGIFTPQQFGILVGVHARMFPPDRLDALLDDSGKPQAITEEQREQAMPLLTPSMMVALMQIFQLRLAARGKRETIEQGEMQNGETR